MNDTLVLTVEEQAASAAVSKLIQRGAVSARDVAVLRREIFGERSLGRTEVEALLGLDRMVRPDCEAWATFLVEVVTDHVVWSSRPTGIVTEADAEWLFRRADAAKTPASLAVLIDILDGAHRVPHWFAAAVRRRAAAGWVETVESPYRSFAPAACAA